MNEQLLQEESSRGDIAKQLLENELVIEAQELILSNLRDKWENTNTRQSTDREYIYLQIKSFNEVFRHFQSVLTTGKMAKQTLMERLKWKD